MSRERKLLVKAWNLLIYLMGGKIGDGISSINRKFLYELKDYISQPEQEPKFNFDLERMKAAIESPISNVTVDDLAKQVKQEPVAWKVIDKTNGEYMFSRVKPMERAYKYDVVIPLYTAPSTHKPMTQREAYQRGYKQAEHDLKREPLSEATINYYLERLGSSFKWDDGFEAGVKWAEKAHGIGGEE